MHWGVFAISAAHLYLPKLPWRANLPPPLPLWRLVKEWILMLLIKKQLIWKLFIYWYLMSFFHKNNVTKCLGHHYAIWTSDSNFLLALTKVSLPRAQVTVHVCWRFLISWLLKRRVFLLPKPLKLVWLPNIIDVEHTWWHSRNATCALINVSTSGMN